MVKERGGRPSAGWSFDGHEVHAPAKMMVKPEGADGAEDGAGDAVVHEPPASNEPAEADADAMTALLHVGKGLEGVPLPSAAGATPGQASAFAQQRDVQRVKNEHKIGTSRSRSPTRSPKGSPARCVTHCRPFFQPHQHGTPSVGVPSGVSSQFLFLFFFLSPLVLLLTTLLRNAFHRIQNEEVLPGQPVSAAELGNDMDESAKMLLLLGELGGNLNGDSDAEAEDSDMEDDAAAIGAAGSKLASPASGARGVGGGTPKRARGGGAKGGSGGASAATNDTAARRGEGVSGPVGEWLKAEGEARMKMADHRRLIYRWTNAIYRLLGMKIPRGMGSLFDKGEKNKREKFDRFLSYYYGTETFEPGTYWYNNADTIQFFIELVRIATCNRTILEPITIQKLFRKKDPTRQASTWIMVQEELDKTNVTAAELRALFEGPPRMEGGFPRGRPLFVPIPKNPKGHHKYNKSGGDGSDSAPPSPAPPPMPREKKEKKEKASSVAQQAAHAQASAVAQAQANAAAAAIAAAQHAHVAHALSPKQRQMAAAAALGFGGAGANANFAAAATAAAQAHAAAVHQHAQVQHQHAHTFAAHEAMMRSTAAAAAALGMVPGNSLHMDAATATAMNLAQRQNSIAALLQGTMGGAGGPPRNFEAVAEAAAAAAAAAPGACEGITLAPGSSPTTSGPNGAHARRYPFGAHSSGNHGHKRQKLEGAALQMPIKRTDPPAAVPMPEMPVAPTRLVGEILLGTLGNVLGKVFGMKTTLSSLPENGAANSGDTMATAEGRERLMSLSEEVTRRLPDLTSVEDDSPIAGGRATREPTVDRTALNAEVDSVIVAAKAAESTWKRYIEAHVRVTGGATKARNLAAQCEAARAELAGAKLARDATMNGAVDLDPALNTTVQKQINEKIARASEIVTKLQAEVAEANAAEAEARGQAATAGRAFKPPYEEVRKRALRLRLAAEERAERQIGRALSRADRDLQNKTARLRELRESKTGEDDSDAQTSKGVNSSKREHLADLERRFEVALAGLKKIREAAEGAKTSIEWSKQAISNLERVSKAP